MPKKSKKYEGFSQCVNSNNKTIGTIINYGQDNLFIPTVETEPVSSLPILAMIKANPEEKAKKTECTGSKCSPGFQTELPVEAKRGWTEAIFGTPTPKEQALDAER